MGTGNYGKDLKWERHGIIMKKVVVIGYGNVGKAVVEALMECGDFTLTGIVSILNVGEKVQGVTIVSELSDVPSFDVAILALPSRTAPSIAAELLKKGISTVDSYDIHSEIPRIRKELNEIALANNAASIISAGWDPGTDSVIRALLLSMAPKGITNTNFGPGMSMGHTVAVKAIRGVKDALSMTIPVGSGIHRRMVYVELEEGAVYNEIEAAIKADDYFVHDETYVMAVESVNNLKDVGHGVHIERKGVSGVTHNQLFEFNMKINNPALTAQILVSAARAVLRQRPGCYTLIEIPPVDYLEIGRDEAVHLLV